MATIATRVFGDGTSTLFTLYNEEFVRSLGFTNGWTTLRVGILCAIQGSGTFIQTTNTNGVGLCTGATPIENTQGFRSATTTNWAGCVWTNTTFATTTFTYNTGPPAYYSTTQFSMACKRGANGHITDRQTAVAAFWAVAGSGNRGFLFFDFLKSGGLGAVTVSPFVPATQAQAQANYTMADMISVGEQIRFNTTINIKGTAISRHVVFNTLATDESFGQFDTLSIMWGTPSVPLEVYGIVAYAIYNVGL